MSLIQYSFKPGDIIANGFEVLEVLGKGAVGTVYLTEQTSTKDFFAIKALNPDLVNSEQAREIFLREAKIWNAIDDHQNIVKSYGVVKDGNDLFILMEYVAPGSSGISNLAGRIQNNTLSLGQIISWSIQICEGMTHAYHEGIRAHRDIKPQNILITRQDVVKITDFGLASVMAVPMPTEDRENPIPSCVRNHEDLDPCVGTYLYMSPEHYRNPGLCDERSDIYSYGVVLYEMVSGGKYPFLAPLPANNSQEEIDRFVLEMQRLHTEVSPAPLKSPLDPIILKCLNKNPEYRYQCFAELQGVLTDAIISTNSPLPEKEKPKKADRGELLAARGLVYYRLSRFEEAVRHFQTADTFEQLSPEFIPAWADSLASAGYEEGALELYYRERREGRLLHDARLFYGYGMLWAKLGEHETAAFCLVQCMPDLEHEPGFREVYFNPFLQMVADPKVRPFYAALLYQRLEDKPVLSEKGTPSVFLGYTPESRSPGPTPKDHSPKNAQSIHTTDKQITPRERSEVCPGSTSMFAQFQGKIREIFGKNSPAIKESEARPVSRIFRRRGKRR